MGDNPTEAEVPSDDGKTADQHSYLEQLVGEGKRYASLEELAKGRVEADLFIDQLKKETGELRTEMEKRLSLEDLLKQKDASSSEKPAPEPQPADDSANREAEPAPDKSKDDDLGAKVREILESERSKSTTEANLNSVAETLVQTYGSEEKAREAVRARAADLGLSVNFLMETAAASPKAFLEVVGLKESGPKSPGGKTPGAVNSAAMVSATPQRGGEPQTYAEFEALRRDNPAKYFTPKVQNKMYALAREKGDSFFN